MRVLHVITALAPGGAETVLCRLLDSLPRDSFEHFVIAMAGEDVMSPRVRATGAGLTHLSMTPGRPAPLPLLRLRRLIREYQPDLLHTWMYHANVAATIAATGLGAPILWSIRHSLDDFRAEKPSRRAVIRAGAILSGRSNAVIYNSHVSAYQHERLGYRAERSRTIPNGFDPDQFRPDADARHSVRAELGVGAKDLLIGLIARVRPMKDHENFLRAAAQFSGSHPDARFILIGAGATPDEPNLRALIGETGLGNRVLLLGERAKISRYMASLDLVVCSSWTESFPNVIAEAMSCAVPCVSTDVGDVRDIIGDTGLIVPVRNPLALCAAWDSILSRRPEALLELGHLARTRIVERYSLAAMTDGYLRLYEEFGRSQA